MTTATTKKPVKTQRRPTCGHCKERFRTTSATKSFCTPECQKAAKAAKRKSKNINDASHSAFFYHLVSEVKRAGNMVVLHGHTPESLAELHAVYKQAFRANQFGDVKHFHMSHIASVKGKNTLGLLHAHNLVISPAALNRAHGVKHYGAGKYISRTSIDPRHSVAKDEREGAVLVRLIAYLGEDVVAAAVKLANIKPTDGHKHLAWLRDNLDPTNPEHAVHLDSIEKMKGKQLKDLRAEIEGKEVQEYAFKRTVHSDFAVLSVELNRHAVFRPELQEFAERLQQVSMAKRNPWVVNEEDIQALFDILHGRDVEEVQDVLDELLVRNSVGVALKVEPEAEVIEYAEGVIERIFDYMPLTIPLCRFQTETGWYYGNATPF